MAKRKTPKKDKIVDLKPKADKLEEKELEQLQQLVRSIDMLNMELGRLETHKHAKLHESAGLQDSLKLMQGKLEDKYGKVDVDIRTGELKQIEDGQANS